MNKMFQSALAFGQDISGWDVSKVSNMSQMFYNTQAFNADIGQWDMSSVLAAEGMFGMSNFNRSLEGWDLSGARYIKGMFEGNRAFNSSVSNWKFNSGVNIDYSAMFKDATSFNQPLVGWDMEFTSNTMGFLSGATSFEQDLSHMHISRAFAGSGTLMSKSMEEFAGGATKFMANSSLHPTLYRFGEPIE
jgi:surface protein